MTAQHAHRRTSRALAAAVLATAGLLLAPGAAHADHEDPPTNQELLEECGKSTDVCEFRPEGEPERFLGEKQLVVDDAVNCTSVEQRQTRRWERSSGSSLSTGFAAGADVEFPGIFKAAVEVQYGHEWSWDSTVGGEVALFVKPGKVGQMHYQPTMETVRGTYELHFPDRFHGHYIWYVPFEATQNVSKGGNPNEGGDPGAITWDDRDMTEDERALCG